MLFHFRIQLEGIRKPPIWRELTVPANFSFDAFHRVLQAAFGWNNAHLYLFSREGFLSTTWIKVPDPEDEDGDIRVLDARRTKLKDIFPANQRYTYIYDFGDDWRHQIKLLRISEGDAIHALLTAGKGACPPEDCGGIPGYEVLKATLAAPGNPGSGELRKWLGMEKDEFWNAAYFDLQAAGDEVRRILA